MKQPLILRLVCLSLASVFLCLSVSLAAANTPGPVVLVTIDTVRADHVGAYGDRRAETPTLDSLARSSALFTHAYTVVPMTVPSHAALLTGTYPLRNGVRDFAGSKLPENLPTLAQDFHPSGYRTAAFISAYVTSAIWGFGRGFDEFDARLPGHSATAASGPERKAGPTIDAALAWLARQPDSHFFVWIHLFDPHYPYEPPQPFRSRFAGRLYDGEIAYADHHLGRFFAALRARGWFDPATICVTSDHGESLGEHGEREHAFFIFDATLHVPLLLKTPGVTRGQRIDAPVTLLDIAPTLASLARIRALPTFEGHSLLPLVAGKPAPPAPLYAESFYPRRSFGWHEETSWREGRWKLIDSGPLRLFDLQSDPKELHDLRASHAALAFELHNRLTAFLGRFGPTSNNQVSAAAAEALSSLGYVSVSVSAATSASGELLDPFDEIGVYDQLVAASDTAVHDRTAADGLFATLLHQHPELVGGWFAAATNALALHQPQKAVYYIEHAVKLQPDFEAAYLTLAHAEAETGAIDRAEKALAAAEKLAPRDSRLAQTKGELALLRHDPASAEADFRKAIELGDYFGDAGQELGRLLVGQHRYEEAVSILAHSLALNPDNALALNNYGIALGNTGHSPQAIEAYQRAIALTPNYAVAHLNLAFELQRSGDQRAAEEQRHAVCRLDATLCRRFFTDAPQPR